MSSLPPLQRLLRPQQWTKNLAAFAGVIFGGRITEPGSIAHGSAAILAVMDGLQIQWLLDPTAVDLGRASEFAIEAIVAAVVEPRRSVLADG